MAIDKAELEKRLTGQLETAKRRTQASAEALGVKQREDRDPTTFIPRAIRVKKEAVATAELRDSRLAVDEAIEDLMQRASFATDAEAREKRLQLNDQASKLQRLVLSKALEIRKQLGMAKLDQAEKLAILGGLAKTAKGIGFAFTTRDTDPKSQISTEAMSAERQGPVFRGLEQPQLLQEQPSPIAGRPMSPQIGTTIDIGQERDPTRFGGF